MNERFTKPRYFLRRDIWSVVGAKLYIRDDSGQVILFARQKAWKLREDIKLYADDSMQQELLAIKARQIIDFSAAYEVLDSTTQQKVGTLRRRGLKSILRDSWDVLDASDQVVGHISEDSLLLALVRRFLTNLIPQSYQVLVNEQPVVRLKQNFNPFVVKLTADFEPGSQLDRRLGLAAAVLLCVIDPKQN